MDNLLTWILNRQEVINIKDNTVRYFYEQSILSGYSDLQNTIEFLLKEKEVISYEDDISVLDFYFKPNNKKRMAKLLKEYKKQKGDN